jgi:hypothetical protein
MEAWLGLVWCGKDVRVYVLGIFDSVLRMLDSIFQTIQGF